MDLFEAIRGRKSIRKFKPDPIPEEDIRAIIEAGILAPSASNRQMWRFVVVTNKDLLRRLGDAVLAKLSEIQSWPESAPHHDRLETSKGWSAFFAEAPATIFVLGEPYPAPIVEIFERHGFDRETVDLLRPRPDIQSQSAAMQNICLAAHAMGYSTCWMTAPCVAAPEMKEILGVQPPWEIMALIPIGIADQAPSVRPRKPLDEVLEFVK